MAKITCQKYVDSDLATAEPTTALSSRYGTVDRTRQYAIIVASIAAIVLAGLGLVPSE